MPSAQESFGTRRIERRRRDIQERWFGDRSESFNGHRAQRSINMLFHDKTEKPAQIRSHGRNPHSIHLSCFDSPSPSTCKPELVLCIEYFVNRSPSNAPTPASRQKAFAAALYNPHPHLRIRTHPHPLPLRTRPRSRPRARARARTLPGGRRPPPGQAPLSAIAAASNPTCGRWRSYSVSSTQTSRWPSRFWLLSLGAPPPPLHAGHAPSSPRLPRFQPCSTDLLGPTKPLATAAARPW
jgi:hypothetical protein